MPRLRNNWRFITAVVAISVPLMFLVGCTKIAATEPESPQVIRDISYVPGSNNPFQQLDLYLPPKAQAPCPVIIWIHGGAWIAGDKNHPPLLPLSQGYAIASLNYRLAQHCPHPAQINDCKAAVRWLKQNALKYNLDGERIGVWGHSAGGHLTALLSTTGDVNVVDGDKSETSAKQQSAVQAACDWAGPTNLDSIAWQQSASPGLDFKDPAGPLAIFLGGKAAAKCAYASPVDYVSKDDAPLLIVHGAQDNIVPAAQSQELYKKMKQAGLQVECLILPDEDHGVGSRTAVQHTLAFFNKYLKQKPAYQPQPK